MYLEITYVKGYPCQLCLLHCLSIKTQSNVWHSHAMAHAAAMEKKRTGSLVHKDLQITLHTCCRIMGGMIPVFGKIRTFHFHMYM